MFELKVPTIVVLIGEGGSGGALALAIGNYVMMLENSTYSVISPEGCAAILWKKSELGPEDFSRAAEALKMTSANLLGFMIIDEVIPEPSGGAHRDPEMMAKSILEKVLEALEDLKTKSPGKLVEERYRRLKKIGSFTEEVKAATA